jgi:hypothetical protein
VLLEESSCTSGERAAAHLNDSFLSTYTFVSDKALQRKPQGTTLTQSKRKSQGNNKAA